MVWSAPLWLALELPPLAFGPALPPPYQMPRELSSAENPHPVRVLGICSMWNITWS